MSEDCMPKRSPSCGPRSNESDTGALMWRTHTDSLQCCLNELEVTDDTAGGFPNDLAFAKWRDATVALRRAGRVIYLVGNGASASMASHFAADLAKNGHVHTQVFTDLALLTAVANDVSFDQVFVEPLRTRLVPADMLVAISSSGNSPNVVNACRFAAQVGATVVTISAMQPGNAIRVLGNLNFWIPAGTYGMAETGHACILHYWMDSISSNGTF